MNGGRNDDRRVVIVYDLGAAVPVDILTSLHGVAAPVFVLPDSAYGRRIATMLDGIAEVAGEHELAELEPDGITTFSDFQMDTTARLAESLGLPFHSTEVAADITRKFRQRRVLNDAGVGGTPTALITDRVSALRALDEVPLPAVLKPNRGVGGRNTYLVESREQLLRLVGEHIGGVVCADDDGYVLEKRMVGQPADEPWAGYVSVESMVRSGVVTHLGITGKFALSPPFREHGGFVPPRPGQFDEDVLFEFAARALTALGIRDGVCHTEIMLTADGPEIIEVNGRSGGNIYDLFLRGHGVNLIELGVRIALGDTPEVAPRTPEEVVFHYFGLAPLSARRLTAVPGLENVRAMPEVSRLDLNVPPGAELDWRRGFRERVYSCRGSVPSHGELAGFLPTMRRTLDARYD
ncbi:ATP-grasp domain-containing protein [Actinophytocola glycyrrhizae]|uniref:Acetyl-CoA carboxylase biotin carboxylase subunit family protein n=1 Tax=Actinophytocola glycyrrhizae TaxID=2044873 RepID=A0ABV9S6V8_9PSEU